MLVKTRDAACGNGTETRREWETFTRRGILPIKPIQRHWTTRWPGACTSDLWDASPPSPQYFQLSRCLHPPMALALI
jgi:hypothetical protein